MVEAHVVEQRIREGLEGLEHVEVKLLTPDGRHLEAVVVSSAFRGVPPVERHRMVYAALGELMDGPLHALMLRTLTPEAWTQGCGVSTD